MVADNAPDVPVMRIGYEPVGVFVAVAMFTVAAVAVCPEMDTVAKGGRFRAVNMIGPENPPFGVIASVKAAGAPGDTPRAPGVAASPKPPVVGFTMTTVRTTE